jgi:hypothetical protein
MAVPANARFKIEQSFAPKGSKNRSTIAREARQREALAAAHGGFLRWLDSALNAVRIEMPDIRRDEDRTLPGRPAAVLVTGLVGRVFQYAAQPQEERYPRPQ